jgi:hypothetical protein
MRRKCALDGGHAFRHRQQRDDVPAVEEEHGQSAPEADPVAEAVGRVVVDDANTSTGGSSFSIVTVRFQPGLGWKLTKKSPSGSCTTIFVVSAPGRSFGTRIAKREKLSAGTELGLTVI